MEYVEKQYKSLYDVASDLNDILQEGECGRAKVSKYEITKNDVRAAIERIPCGKYVRLIVDGELAMSNTSMECRTNSEFFGKVHGRVLVGGLGIGLILLGVQNKNDVDEIVVVEKSQDVIDLVAPQLPLNSKVHIVCADINDYIPEGKFNTIYLDIWNYVNSDVYNDSMKPLKRRYRKWLMTKEEDPNRYIDCWAIDAAKNNYRLF